MPWSNPVKEQRVRWHARETDSPAIRARLAELNNYVFKNVNAIDSRFAPHLKEANRRATRILNENKSMRAKMLDLWSFTDFVTSFYTESTACKRGCSHCCHIAVSVSKTEAELIGERTGIRPASAPSRMNGDHIEWGYHNPCPFLRNSECSIYEWRPIACRIHYSLDKDDLLCRLSPPNTNSVPYINTENLIKLTLLVLTADGSFPHFSDIREWFPAKVDAPREVVQ